MIKLFHSNISTCSQRVRQVLHEKGVVWEDCHVLLDKDEHLSEAYLSLNPNGLVPTLVVDGRAIPDSSAILEYLEDAYPEPSLRPNDLVERAQMRAWINYIDEVPTAATRYLSFQRAFGKRLSALTDEQRLARASGRPLREGFYRQLGPHGFSNEALDLAERQILQSLTRAENALKNSKWLVGDNFSLADVSFLPTVVRLEDIERFDLLDNCPKLKAWYDRCQQRPSFEAGYYAEARVKINRK